MERIEWWFFMQMSKIRTILENGGAVILPTETVYGLFAKALDEDAVERVYALKRRPKEKALNLNVSSLEEIYRFSQNPPIFLEKVYNRFMPGPLTIILKSNNNVPFWINSGRGTVGFRVPKHEKTLQLIRDTGPLIGPSANISGESSGIHFASIVQAFAEPVSGLADDTAITGVDSTILDLSEPVAKILRQGVITKDELLEAIPELRF